MLQSIYIGLTGLESYSRGLQLISNNVVNLNTPGFKGSTLRFSDLYYMGVGVPGLLQSGSRLRFGAGVTYSQSMLDFRQGQIRASSGDLDMAIEGRGFLVMYNGTQKLYARTGQFAVDSEGFISEQTLGYRLGILTPGGGLQTFSVNGRRSSPPKATTQVTFSNNLSADGKDHVISGVEVYDANGGKHTWSVHFTNKFSDTAGKWDVTVQDENGATVKDGSILFNGSAPVSGSDKITVNLTAVGGAASSIVLDFSRGVTGFSSGTTSTLSVGTKDGYGAGELSRVSLDTDGQIKLDYSNGQSEKAGYVALADFQDLQGLTQLGAGIFQAPNDMQPSFGQQGQGDLGKLHGQSIEASNVDLSQEFGQLILDQRGYQASSQIVSVANEMIQQLFDLRGRA